MDTQSIFDQLSESLIPTLSKVPKEIADEILRNSRSVIQSSLNRMDVVTREEFDAQTAVLQRTREKLEKLEIK